MGKLATTIEAAKDIGRPNLDAQEREVARRSIFRMYKCATRRPSGAPTVRTALINDTLGKACSRLQRAALAASGHLLVERAFNDIEAEGKRWEEEIGIARELLRSAGAELEALTSAV